MPEVIFIIVLHFTVMGYSGRALPSDAAHRKAFVEQSDCRKAIPAVRRALASSPVAPDRIVCERMEIMK